MKKNIIAILLLAAFLMVVIHEMISHHHHDMDGIELFSHHQTSDKQDTNPQHGTSNHFPFHTHHHILDSEAFDMVRVDKGLGWNFNFSISSCFFITNYLSWFAEAQPPENTFYSDFTIPLHSLPFILSPNAMRGSPSIA